MRYLLIVGNVVVIIYALLCVYQFPIPKKRNRVAEVCYSPARPLELAWQECLTKGFMLVKNVFSHSVIE
jgi:hypothetical protein